MLSLDFSHAHHIKDIFNGPFLLDQLLKLLLNKLRYHTLQARIEKKLDEELPEE